MNKMLRWYALFLVLMLIMGGAILWISQNSGFNVALGKLGKTPADFAEARTQLLLSNSDPTQALLSFVTNMKNPPAARNQAFDLLGQYALRQHIEIDSTLSARVLRDTTHSVQLSALKFLEMAQTDQGMFTIEKIFSNAIDTALFQQSFRTLKSISNSIDYVINRVGDSASNFDSCVDIAEKLPIKKGLVYKQIYEKFIHDGDSTSASRFILPFIDAWYIIGAWDNKSMSSFYKQLSPEKREFSKSDTFIISDGTISRWFSVNKLEDYLTSKWVNLQNLFVKNTYTCAYAVTQVTSPIEQDALFFIGSDDGVVVFVNDAKVYEHKIFRACIPDEDVCRIHLKAGSNTIMLKVLQDVGGWGFTCRIANFKGLPLTGIENITLR